MKAGKAPYDFLNQKNVDSLMEGMRPKSQMAMDRVVATGEGAPAEQQNVKLPPAPAGVDTNMWAKVISMPPPMESGKPFPHAAWGHAVSMLLADPSPEKIALFDGSKFAKSGITAKQILSEFRKEAPQGGAVDNPFADAKTIGPQ